MEEYQKIFSVDSRVKNYDVCVFDTFKGFINYSESFTLLIVDSSLKNYFKDYNKEIFFLECTEETKSWENLELVLSIFIKNRIDRKSKILLVGGGVLQDSVSFCCSIFNRGIDFEYVPTTLLSLVDSCIGGKTSINFKGFKNKLGNYYPPDKIFIIPDFLKSLSKKEIYSGYGEVFKFYVLQNRIEEFKSFSKTMMNFNRDIIVDCLKYKASIIEVDEFDNGIRLKLNFGHTFGHAIESLAEYNVPHGIGVVFGICVANEISEKVNSISIKYKLEVEDLAIQFLSKIEWEEKWLNFELLLERIKQDKKNLNGIRMILRDEKLNDFVLLPVSEKVLRESLSNLKKRLELCQTVE